MNISKLSLIPAPVKVSDIEKNIVIGTISNTKFILECTDEFAEGGKLICKAFEAKALAYPGNEGYKISVSVNPDDSRFEDKGKSEGYILEVKDTEAELIGYDNAGAYYACVSFSKLISTDASNVYLPECSILDYPKYSTRGHFMECRYGSEFMTLDDWKDAIDYLSEMKINTITLGMYGCWNRQYDGTFSEYQYFPLKKFPELKTPKNIKYYSAKKRQYIYKHDLLPEIYKEDYFGEFIQYAKTKHINVFPLFNSLGHNTLIPRVFPEISAKDEDGNLKSFGFCTNNEKTYEVMFDIYDEIIDRYLTPNGVDSFEIGMDEVWPSLGIDESDLFKSTSPFCECEKCRGKEQLDIIIDYIIKVVKHLKAKGMKNVYVYHDMLFYNDRLDEDLKERFIKEDIYDAVVIDWWAYAGYRTIFRYKAHKVHDLFRSIGKPMTGYFHYNMPTQLNENIYAMSEKLQNHNFEGMITYSAFEYCYDFNFNLFADCAWNPEPEVEDHTCLERYARITFPENSTEALEALKIVQNFTNGRNTCEDSYLETIFDYYGSSYLSKVNGYPQDYPSRQFRLIRDKEDRYLAYFKNIIRESEYAYNIFDNKCNGGEKAGIWKLICATHNTLADEFYTIYTKANELNCSKITPWEFVNEMNRLIAKRERTIALLEDVRIDANVYTHARNMSICRQFTIDLKENVKAQIEKGGKVTADIYNMWPILSDISKFLR